MTALELLTDLRDRGVKLWVDGADLRFSAGKGTLGRAAAEQLARHKTELVELLKSPSTGAATRHQDSARAKRTYLLRTPRDLPPGASVCVRRRHLVGHALSIT